MGTVNSIGIYVLPNVLGAFREAFPDVDVRIDFKEVEGVISQVESGRVDFAIIPWNRKYGDLLGIPLQPVKMFLVALPDPPPGRRRAGPPARPRTLPVRGISGRALHAHHDRQPSSSASASRCSTRSESANAATIKHMVMAGMGLAIVPEFAVADELRSGELARIEVPMMTMSQELTVYLRRNRTLSRARAQFLDFLQEYFSRPAPSRRPRTTAD